MLNWLRGNKTKEETPVEDYVDEELRDRVQEFSDKLGSRTHVAVRRWSAELYDYMELRYKNKNPLIYYRAMGSDQEWNSGGYYISDFMLIDREQYNLLQDTFDEIHEAILALGHIRIGSESWTLPKQTTQMALREFEGKAAEHILMICNMYSDLTLNIFTNQLRVRHRLIKASVENQLITPGSQLMVLDKVHDLTSAPSTRTVTVLAVYTLEQLLDKVPLDGTGVFLNDLIVREDSTGAVKHMSRHRLITPDAYKFISADLK